MRALITVLFISSGSAALADPGHWGNVAGHSHWIAAAALGLAGLAALLGALTGNKKNEAEAEDTEELEEEAA